MCCQNIQLRGTRRSSPCGRTRQHGDVPSPGVVERRPRRSSETGRGSEGPCGVREGCACHEGPCCGGKGQWVGVDGSLTVERRQHSGSMQHGRQRQGVDTVGEGACGSATRGRQGDATSGKPRTSLWAAVSAWDAITPSCASAGRLYGRPWPVVGAGQLGGGRRRERRLAGAGAGGGVGR